MNAHLLLTEDQACEVLGISRATLWRLHETGQGPTFVKIRSLIRYPVAELEAWVNGMVEAQRDDAERQATAQRADVAELARV